MSQSTAIYARIVFLVSVGAYIPLTIGGWQHPSEINVASYGLWLVIAIMLLYSSWKQDFSGVLMPLGYLVGNLAMLIFAFFLGGYTFNLGPAETMTLYGIVGTICVWLTFGQFTKRWGDRILYLGGITADLLSFYPQWKQYLRPHEYPTTWMLCGWWCWIIGSAMNVILVERLFAKLMMSKQQYELQYNKAKRPLLILEESAFSIENFFFMTATVILMTR